MPHFFRLLTISITAVSLFSAPLSAQQAADAYAPEPSTETAVGLVQEATSKNWMVSAANPHAVKAGAKILKEGGNAIDAMVAVQTMLGLTEPQSSGLGGGAFLLYWNAATKRLHTFDGRETAPAAINPKLFLGENGKPIKFFDAVVSGLSVGVPGMPRLLHEVHQKYGKTEWNKLFDSPIALAENGFEISPRLAGLMQRRQKGLSRFNTTRAYFFDAEGQIKQRRTLLKNPAYAKTLRAFRDEGADTFYTGEIGKAIVDAVQNAKGRPGTLALADLANYKIKERKPVCAPYRGHEVCGMGPPSSGAIAVSQILGALEPFDLKTLGPANATSWQLIGDATRLAFADRGRYVADEDYLPVPTKGLLAAPYLKERSALIKQGTRLANATPGTPKFEHALNRADDQSLEIPSTTHFVIRDSAGNIVSMTSTIESAFGSNIMVGGFLLNNQLTDFSFRTHVKGVPIANAAAPGKRPRSSMAPTIILKDGKPVIALGSPGGSRIIPYVAQSIIGVLDWGLSLKQAFDIPHITNRFGTFDLEARTGAANQRAALEALGYRTVTISLNSGLHGIIIQEDGTLVGAADRRREGIVIGE